MSITRSFMLAFVLAGGCGNDLPSAGECAIPAATGDPVVTQVPLVGQAAFFDDLRYSPALGKVLAAPEGAGRIFVVDPETLEVAMISANGGTASVDADARTIFAADRGNDRIVAFDAASGALLTSIDLGANPDYVRVVPGGGELWVTLPGEGRIEVISIAEDPVALARVDSIRIPGAPEGLTFGEGRGYTQAGGSAITIDIAQRLVVGEDATGCGSSHGFPQVDDGYGLVVAGCGSAGGAAVVSREGKQLTGFEAGGDAAVLAYDGARHHLYLRGDPGSNLAMIAVCPDGGMTVMAEVPISDSGHASTVDELGNVWIADATTGGLQRVSDPFAGTE
jgi:DNA-binding beta-propeller fold protein YncE